MQPSAPKAIDTSSDTCQYFCRHCGVTNIKLWFCCEYDPNWHALKRDGSCLLLPDNTSNVRSFYCSKKCQKAEWKNQWCEYGGHQHYCVFDRHRRRKITKLMPWSGLWSAFPLERQGAFASPHGPTFNSNFCPGCHVCRNF